jgi:hypothetical protein
MSVAGTSSNVGSEISFFSDIEEPAAAINWTSREKATPTEREKLYELFRESPHLRGMTWIDYATFIMFYLGLGVLLTFPTLATTYWFISVFHVSNRRLTYAQTGIMIPWCFKFVYGFISDNVPLMGYRRKPYVFICLNLTAVMWAVITSGVTEGSYKQSVCVFLAMSLSLCFGDVVVDTVVVDMVKRLPPEYADHLVGLIRISRSMGELLSGYMSGKLVHSASPQFVFKLTMFLCIFMASLAFFIRERRFEYMDIIRQNAIAAPAYSGNDTSLITSMLAQGKITKSEAIDLLMVNPGMFAPSEPIDSKSLAGMSRCGRCKLRLNKWRKLFLFRGLVGPIIYTLIYTVVPGVGSVIFYYQTALLGFTATDMGFQNTLAGLGHLTGLLTYKAFNKMGIRRNMVIAISIEVISYILLYLNCTNRTPWISNLTVMNLFVFLNEFPAGFSIIPLQVLVTENIPRGYEGTVFSCLMSVFNLGNILSDNLAVVVADFFHVTSDPASMHNFYKIAMTVAILHFILLPTIPYLLPRNKGTKDIDIGNNTDLSPLDMSRMIQQKQDKASADHNNHVDRYLASSQADLSHKWT